jgi:hypothetical protein
VLAVPAQTGHDFLCIHAHLDDFQGNPSTNRPFLFCHPDDAKASLPDLLQKLVVRNAVARFFGFQSGESSGESPIPAAGTIRKRCLLEEFVAVLVVCYEQLLQSLLQRRMFPQKS